MREVNITLVVLNNFHHLATLYPIYPKNLSSKRTVFSICRVPYENDKRPKVGIFKLQFLIIVIVSLFAYFVLLILVSFVYWIWKDLIKVQLIGSCSKGFEIEKDFAIINK